jgi:hypothetical protein
VFESEGEGSDGGIQELTTTVPAGTAAKRLSPMRLMRLSRGRRAAGKTEYVESAYPKRSLQMMPVGAVKIDNLTIGEI